MLLHMVQSHGPVDPSHDPGANSGRGPLDKVQDAGITQVDAFDDSRCVNKARIARLAPTRRVKGRSVQFYASPSADAVGYLGHGCFENRKVRIFVIETFCCCHWLNTNRKVFYDNTLTEAARDRQAGS